MPVLYFIASFLLICQIFCFAPPSNFCDEMEAICLNSGQVHLACGGILTHNEDLGTKPIKVEVGSQLFLDLHNELRNMLACGEPKMVNLAGEVYPRAVKLQKLIWDEELEWAADLNAKTCSGYHDCKLTPTHRFASQNLGLRTSLQAFDIQELIKNIIKAWFLEYLNTPISVVDSYSTDTIKSDDQITLKDMHQMEHILQDKTFLRENTHFTEMMRDKTSRIGCALYTCGESENGMPFTYYMVCNYQSGNVEGSGVYKKGDISGSQCDAKSKEFHCLCLDPSEQTMDNNQNIYDKSKLILRHNHTKVIRLKQSGNSKKPIIVQKPQEINVNIRQTVPRPIPFRGPVHDPIREPARIIHQLPPPVCHCPDYNLIRNGSKRFYKPLNFEVIWIVLFFTYF